MVLGISIRSILYVVYFVVSSTVGTVLVMKTDGFRNLGWSVIVSLILLSAYVALANLLREGAPLAIVSPVLAAVCPLFTIAGAVLFLGEAASVTRIGLLVGACVMIGVAAKN